MTLLVPGEAPGQGIRAGVPLALNGTDHSGNRGAAGRDRRWSHRRRRSRRGRCLSPHSVRLLARPDVAERLEQLQRQTVDHAQSRLMALIDPAADALGDVLIEDSGPTARVQAARAVFSQALAFKQAGNLRLAVIGEETAG